MQKSINRYIGFGLCAFTVFVLFVIFAPALASASHTLSTDMNIATAGYYRLHWSVEESSSSDEFDLQKAVTPNFENPENIYKGHDLAAAISGKSNAKYYYRVTRTVERIAR